MNYYVTLLVLRKFTSLDLIVQGTGSYPCPPQGWHDTNLLKDSHPPNRNPCLLTASTPYCEQVGVYRQLEGR